MKKISHFVAVGSFIMLGVNGCMETGPDITLKLNTNIIGDTTYIESPVAAPEIKNVLIEDFTGVRCPNCPQGHQIIEAVKAAHPGRVASVSLHPINSLGAPYSFSVQDFRSQKAQDLFDYLGQIGLQPAAGIDRIKFSGENAILLEKSKWANYVTQQLAVPAPVNVLLQTQYDSVSREATIAVELHYTQTVTEQSRLTVALIENKIVTAQLNGAVIDTFYNHKDIMRDFLTATQGDAITTTLETGRVVRKVYKRTLDPVWKPENMQAVAYVHQFSSSKQIYQVKETHIIP